MTAYGASASIRTGGLEPRCPVHARPWRWFRDRPENAPLLPFAAHIEVARLVGPLCFGRCSNDQYAAKLQLNESDPGSSLSRTIEPQSAPNRERTLRLRRL